jgi:hypothetical protein
MRVSTTSYNLIPLLSKYSLNQPVLTHPHSLNSSHNMPETNFHAHIKLQAKLYFCVLISTFSCSRREGETF